MSLTNKNEIKKYLRLLLESRRLEGKYTKANSIGSDVYSYIELIVRAKIEELVDHQAGKFKRLHDPMAGVTQEMRNAIKPRKRRKTL